VKETAAKFTNLSLVELKVEKKQSLTKTRTISGNQNNFSLN
jgi:hypothetical protein